MILGLDATLKLRRKVQPGARFLICPRLPAPGVPKVVVGFYRKLRGGDRRSQKC